MNARGARVARFCLPSPMWYVAVCQQCRWAGFDWKDRKWAERERDEHNERCHVLESEVAAIAARALLAVDRG